MRHYLLVLLAGAALTLLLPGCSTFRKVFSDEHSELKRSKPAPKAEPVRGSVARQDATWLDDVIRGKKRDADYLSDSDLTRDERRVLNDLDRDSDVGTAEIDAIHERNRRTRKAHSEEMFGKWPWTEAND